MVSLTLVPLENGDVDGRRPYARDVPNQPPVLVSPIPDLNAVAGVSFSYDLSPHFSDPDGDPLTFTDSGLPPGLTLSASSGVISGIPSGVFSGPITYTATDPGGLSAQDTSALEVAPAPTPGDFPRNGVNLYAIHLQSAWQRLWDDPLLYECALRASVIQVQGLPEYSKDGRAQLQTKVRPFRDARPNTRLGAYINWSEVDKNKNDFWDINKMMYQYIVEGPGKDLLQKDENGRYMTSNWLPTSGNERWRLNAVGNNAGTLMADWYGPRIVQSWRDLDNGGDGSNSLIEWVDGKPPLYNMMVPDVVYEIAEPPLQFTLYGTIASVQSQTQYTLTLDLGSGGGEDAVLDRLNSGQAVQFTLWNSTFTESGTSRIGAYDKSNNRVTVNSTFPWTVASGQEFSVTLTTNTSRQDLNNDGSNNNMSKNGDGRPIYQNAVIKVFESIEAEIAALGITDFTARCPNASNHPYHKDLGRIEDTRRPIWENFFDHGWTENHHVGLGLRKLGSDNYQSQLYDVARGCRYIKYEQALTRPASQAPNGHNGMVIMPHIVDYYDRHGGPRPIDQAVMRGWWAHAMMFELVYWYCLTNYQYPGYIDEVIIDLGQPSRSRDLMPDYDLMNQYASSPRAFDVPTGLYVETFANGLVAWDGRGLGDGQWIASHLSGGQAATTHDLSAFIPSGKSLYRFDSSYVNPTNGDTCHSAWRDDAFNDGRHQGSTWDSGPFEGICLLYGDPP